MKGGRAFTMKKYKETPDLISPTRVVVENCDGLNIREAGNAKAPVRFIASRGTMFTTYSSLKNEWAEVTDDNGETGFAMTKYLEEVTDESR